MTQRLEFLESIPDFDKTLIWTAMVTMVIAVLMLTTVRPHLNPPGPRLLPVIGNLHLLWTCDDVRDLARKLRHQYGDIYSLYLGRRLVIVINGMALLKEAFYNNGEKLANRPHSRARKGILNSNGKTWRRTRRFVRLTFRDLGVKSSVLEAKIAPEMIQLASTIIDLGPQPFNPSTIIRKTVFNVSFSVTLGDRFPWHQPEAVELFNKLTDVIGHSHASPFAHSTAWPAWLPWKRLKGLQKADDQLRQFVRHCIKERLQMLDDDALCITDAYLLQIRDNGAGDKFHDSESLVQLVLELLHSGTESLSSTLQWLLLYLALYPDAQIKTHQEIDRELGGSFPVWSDVDRLPYLEAFILESQRLADVKHFSMTHAASEALMLDGFNIPESALLVPSITSALYDERMFPNPEEFKPERFLGRRGERLKDLSFIPFFLGRRMCPGQLLARMELFLLTAALIQHFTFELPEDAPPPSLQGTLGLTRAPCPFQIVARRRVQL